MEELTFPVRQKPLPLLTGTLVFGTLAFYAFLDASHNSRALIINGIIDLSPSQAFVFRWILAGFCVVATTLSIVFFAIQSMTKREVRLSADAISCPSNPFSSAHVSIKYSSIIGLRVVKLSVAGSSQYVLKVSTPERTYGIPASSLQNQQAFQIVCTALDARVKANQSSQRTELQR
jgi:hypothetical protein